MLAFKMVFYTIPCIRDEELYLILASLLAIQVETFRSIFPVMHYKRKFTKICKHVKDNFCSTLLPK